MTSRFSHSNVNLYQKLLLFLSNFRGSRFSPYYIIRLSSKLTLRNENAFHLSNLEYNHSKKGQNIKMRHLVPSLVLGATALGSATVFLSDQNEENVSFSSCIPKGTSDFAARFPVAHEELSLLLKDRFTTDHASLEEHGKEVSGYAPRANPDAVVWPISTDEVSEIVKIASKNKIPLVAYGAGTSLEGHTNAVRGGICVNFKTMDKVVDFHRDDMDVVVQPGIGWMELNDYLRPHGFFIGVDPGPGATIGGMCATSCSGTNAVRYGTMKDQVTNLTVVMSDGSIIKTLQRPRKSSAGYDLTRLFIGSEGTLGLITEITLKVRKIPEVTEIAYVCFDSVQDATSAVIETLQEGIQMGAIELLDEVMADAVNKYAGLNLPLKPIILFKFSGSKSHVQDDVESVGKICKKYTKGDYVWCSTQEAKDKIWFGRKHAFWAAQYIKPECQLMSTDVAVPISKLAQAIEDTKKDLEASFLYCPIVGHVGDGNYHVIVMFDPENPTDMSEATRLNHRMVERALQLEGTCTGEHGIGTGKKKYLLSEFGESTVKIMEDIKKALDPDNILNPEKKVFVKSN